MVWKLFSFQKSSCGRRTQKQSLKQWCMGFSENKKSCGIPNFFVKEYYTKDRKHYIMRRKKKAAVLERVLGCSYTVDFSVYNAKPVHFCIWRLRSWM